MKREKLFNSRTSSRGEKERKRKYFPITHPQKEKIVEGDFDD